MEKFIVKGGKRLTGQVKVYGAKNVSLKVLVAACLTKEKVVVHNVPLVSDFFVMADIIKELGGTVEIKEHTATIHIPQIKKSKISLDTAAAIRTSSMFLAPLLARLGKAVIPNPGGCRIGARPIDRIIDGLRNLGSEIVYDSKDGYFHARAFGKRLIGTQYSFTKNTHTGTETLILASVLAQGETILQNTALEPEVDELIALLISMGADIQREKRFIRIRGVESLHGTTFTIGPDRNEIVTFAIAAIITDGSVFIHEAKQEDLREFLHKLDEAGAGYEIKKTGIQFFSKVPLRPTDVVTGPHPGFMTDWQAPWAVLMTKAKGTSVIHETVYDRRFGYVSELTKMGAHIELFNPEVDNPQGLYNFNLDDDIKENFHAIRIFGPTPLHNAVVTVSDLRAGATLVLGALAAKGESTIFGVDLLDRGYEKFEDRLRGLGADIKRLKHE